MIARWFLCSLDLRDRCQLKEGQSWFRECVFQLPWGDAEWSLTAQQPGSVTLRSDVLSMRSGRVVNPCRSSWVHCGCQGSQCHACTHSRSPAPWRPSTATLEPSDLLTLSFHQWASCACSSSQETSLVFLLNRAFSVSGKCVLLGSRISRWAKQRFLSEVRIKSKYRMG